MKQLWKDWSSEGDSHLFVVVELAGVVLGDLLVDGLWHTRQSNRVRSLNKQVLVTGILTIGPDTLLPRQFPLILRTAALRPFPTHKLWLLEFVRLVPTRSFPYNSQCTLCPVTKCKFYLIESVRLVRNTFPIKIVCAPCIVKKKRDFFGKGCKAT